jgi:hypothetical protein
MSRTMVTQTGRKYNKRPLTVEEIADKKRRHAEANLKWKQKNPEKMRAYFREYRAKHGRGRREDAEDARPTVSAKQEGAPSTLDAWGTQRASIQEPSTTDRALPSALDFPQIGFQGHGGTVPA